MSERNRGGQPGINNGNWKGGSQIGLCQYCGKSFTAPAWEIKHRKYCSRHCGDKAKIISGSRKTRPHVKIVERILGHHIPIGSVIHHVNQNKRDNRNCNLILCQDQSYHRLLHARQRILDAGGNPDTDKICSRCKTLKNLDEFHIAPRNGDGRRCYCKPCQSEIYRERT